MKSSPLDEQSLVALRKAYEHPSSSIGNLTEEILKEYKGKKTKAASRRYWGRVYHRLETDQLVEIKMKEKRTEVILADIGKALVEGFMESRKNA